MESITIPCYPVLSGEEAIKALQVFIMEVKEEKSEELTAKQTETLINLAKGLISSIEGNKVSSVKSKEVRIMKRFKKTITRYIPGRAVNLFSSVRSLKQL